MMNRSEADAALCIWEYALSPVYGDTAMAEKFLDWLKQGEGYAAARATVLDIAPLCEVAYVWAMHHGFDTSFDWEFVPPFCRFAMCRKVPSDLNETWAIQTGFRIYQEWRATCSLESD
jgi:hypothetical protein